MNSAAIRYFRERAVLNPGPMVAHVLCVHSPPDKLAIYTEKALEIISKNDRLAKNRISKKSQQDLVALQISLWGKPSVENHSEE